MWGRKEDEAPVAPAQRPEAQRPPMTPEPAPIPRSAATPPPVAAAAPRPAAPSPGSGAQIGKSLKVKGEIAGNEDLYIDGEVEGKITLQGNNLTIGPNGNVRAEVSAHSIIVLGRLQGNVKAADRVEIRKTGSLEGDLVTARIAIEEDAVFRGSIDIVKPAEKGGGAPAGNSNASANDGKAKAAVKTNSPN